MRIDAGILSETFRLNDIYELAIKILDRYASNLEDGNDAETALEQAIDDELVWTCHQWTMLREYCTPQEADYDAAYNNFVDDLYSVISKGAVKE